MKYKITVEETVTFSHELIIEVYLINERTELNGAKKVKARYDSMDGKTSNRT